MTALIVGNGEVSEKIKPLLPENAYVICADGGFRHMDKLGLTPDIVIGDMDSVKADLHGEKTIVYPVRKDFTDSEIAVNYAIDNGFSDLVLIGFTGTRTDHTLTNLFLLKGISERGARAEIIDEHNVIRYAEKENIIRGKKGDIVSIIPIGGDVSGITTEGLDYPLFSETLEFGKGRGVSNEMTGDECRITVKNGSALIIKSKD